MTKNTATLIEAFTALSPAEQAEVIDLIAEYYLARPKNRQALLRQAGSADPQAPAPKAQVNGRRADNQKQARLRSTPRSSGRP